MSLDNFQTLLVTKTDTALHVYLNRPKQRNAMNIVMVKELMNIFSFAETQVGSIRALVLRGCEQNFCAGGDINDFNNVSSSQYTSHRNPIAAYNRRFGELISLLDRLPLVTFALLEGAALGGGLGLTSVCDISIAVKNTQFSMPETQLGIPPAQIAPFVANRIGLSQARRLALLGLRFDAEEAKKFGLVHDVVDHSDALNEVLNQYLKQLNRCAPNATAVTKNILLATRDTPISSILDHAADLFAQAIDGPEGQEGTKAFLEKRKASWS